MIKVYFIDDQESRLETFIHKTQQFDWKTSSSKNFDEAICSLGEELDLREKNIVFLDHDFGDFDKSGQKRTSKDVVRWMIENIKCKSLSVIIHSLNYIDSQEILDIFKNSGWTDVVYKPMAFDDEAFLSRVNSSLGDVIPFDQLIITYTNMTEGRYLELTSGEHPVLTPEEVLDGWHWCLAWDDMLIHNTWEETKLCTCFE